MDRSINQIIEHLAHLRAGSSPGAWRVSGHQVVADGDEVVARIGARYTRQHVNAELICYMHRVVPVLVLEIQRLRAILAGADGAEAPPEDHVEAVDRMVAMLEQAEREAAAWKVLVGLCDRCVDLVYPPFQPCRHQLVDTPHGPGGVVQIGAPLPVPHLCELREQGMMAGRGTLCTCCRRCTVECEHAV